jgi:hypothetical protein
MSKWNRPMRTYRRPVLTCYLCGRQILGETRMVGRELAHPVCANLDARPEWVKRALEHRLPPKVTQ